MLRSSAGVQRSPLNYTYLNSEVLLGVQQCHFNWLFEYFNVIDVDRDVVCWPETLQYDPHLTGCCKVVFQDERHQPDPAHPVTCLWIWQQPWSNSALNCHFHKIILCHLIFVEPCITVKFIKRNQRRCNNVSKFYYSLFIWSSTCFGRHTAHHQEPKTALAASGFSYVEGCWTCGWWTLSGCPTAFHVLKNQRLPEQF
jgi:hypothetical protein